jgi:hypothetical protein
MPVDLNYIRPITCAQNRKGASLLFPTAKHYTVFQKHGTGVCTMFLENSKLGLAAKERARFAHFRRVTFSNWDLGVV